MMPVNFFFIAIALVFVIAVVRQTIRHRLLERDSLLWLLFAAVAIFLSIWPSFIQIVAVRIGVEYAPSLLFLLTTLGLVYIVMKQSLALAQLRSQSRELAQRLAILESQAAPVRPAAAAAAPEPAPERQTSSST
jgi:hypothetical protein